MGPLCSFTNAEETPTLGLEWIIPFFSFCSFTTILYVCVWGGVLLTLELYIHEIMQLAFPSFA